MLGERPHAQFFNFFAFLFKFIILESFVPLPSNLCFTILSFLRLNGLASQVGFVQFLKISLQFELQTIFELIFQFYQNMIFVNFFNLKMIFQSLQKILQFRVA